MKALEPKKWGGAWASSLIEVYAYGLFSSEYYFPIFQKNSDKRWRRPPDPRANIGSNRFHGERGCACVKLSPLYAYSIYVYVFMRIAIPVATRSLDRLPSSLMTRTHRASPKCNILKYIVSQTIVLERQQRCSTHPYAHNETPTKNTPGYKLTR